MNIVAFTGTRHGMTRAQRMGALYALKQLVRRERFTIMLNGAAKGADVEAAAMARKLGMRVIAFPATWGGHPEVLELACEVRAPAMPLVRNQRMVWDAHTLLATPRTMEQELRSGTWATIRYARQRNKRIIIVWPDGRSVDGEEVVDLWG